MKRKIKVYGQCGYKYKMKPTIILKGNWLEKYGFQIGAPLIVECNKDKLVIKKVKT